MSKPPSRIPEGKTIVKRARVLILELHGPGRAAVGRLVYTKIGRVAANGRQVSHPLAHSLHIAKLQCLRPGYDACGPSLAAVRRLHKRSPTAPRPHHTLIHRTHRDQSLCSPAALRRQSWMMNFVGKGERSYREY